MTREIPCVWLEPSDRFSHRLRRFRALGPKGERECPLGYGYHSRDIEIGQVVEGIEADVQERASVLHSPPEEYQEQYPRLCDCGYTFLPDDPWQERFDRLYLLTPGEGLVTLHAAPVGAIWDAPWFVERGRYGGADGRCLVCRTPAGDWVIDGPASNGGRWVRTGEPPRLTVKPSIGFGPTVKLTYHAFLTDGKLIDVGEVV